MRNGRPRSLFCSRLLGTTTKKNWVFTLSVLGELTDAENMQLNGCHDQNHLVMAWLVRIITSLISSGLVTVPPPIYSRIYQELSNGQLGYLQA